MAVRYGKNATVSGDFLSTIVVLGWLICLFVNFFATGMIGKIVKVSLPFEPT